MRSLSVNWKYEQRNQQARERMRGRGRAHLRNILKGKKCVLSIAFGVIGETLPTAGSFFFISSFNSPILMDLMAWIACTAIAKAFLFIWYVRQIVFIFWNLWHVEKKNVLLSSMIPRKCLFVMRVYKSFALGCINCALSMNTWLRLTFCWNQWNFCFFFSLVFRSHRRRLCSIQFLAHSNCTKVLCLLKYQIYQLTVGHRFCSVCMYVCCFFFARSIAVRTRFWSHSQLNGTFALVSGSVANGFFLLSVFHVLFTIQQFHISHNGAL